MNLGRTCKVASLSPLFAELTVAAQKYRDMYDAAVRNNDLPTLPMLLKGSDASLSDNYRTTILRCAGLGSRTHAPEDAQ